MCQTFAFDIHLALICDVQTFVGLELVPLLIGHYAPRRVVCEQDRIVSGKLDTCRNIDSSYGIAVGATSLFYD